MKFSDWLHKQFVHERRDNDDAIISAYGKIPHEVLDHLYVTVYCTVYEGADPNACIAHNALRMQVHEIFKNVKLAHEQGGKKEEEAEVTYDPRFAQAFNK